MATGLMLNPMGGGKGGKMATKTKRAKGSKRAKATRAARPRRAKAVKRPKRARRPAATRLPKAPEVRVVLEPTSAPAPVPMAGPSLNAVRREIVEAAKAAAAEAVQAARPARPKRPKAARPKVARPKKPKAARPKRAKPKAARPVGPVRPKRAKVGAPRARVLPGTPGWRRRWAAATGLTMRRPFETEEWKSRYKAGMQRAFEAEKLGAYRARTLAGVAALNPFARFSRRTYPGVRAGRRPGSADWWSALASDERRGVAGATRARNRRKSMGRATKRKRKGAGRANEGNKRRAKRRSNEANKRRPKRRAKAANARRPKRRANEANRRRRNEANRRRRNEANPLFRGASGRFTGRRTLRPLTVAGLPRRNVVPRYPMMRRPGMSAWSPMGLRARNPLYNAMAVGAPLGVMDMAKSLLKQDALKDIALVTGGFVAGAVLPTLVVKGLNKVGVMKGAGGAVAQVAIGLVASAAAGVATGVVMKDRSAAVKVAAGGIAGVLGVLIVQQLDKFLPPMGMSGLGQQAEEAVRQAVEAEIRKSLGMGDFLTEASAERMLGGLGQSDVEKGAAVFGDFPTVEMVEDAPAVEGFGLAGAETPSDMKESMETFGYAED